MTKVLKAGLICIATLGVTSLANSAFAESASSALPSRAVAAPALPVFELHESAWFEETRKDTIIQLDQGWIHGMGEILDEMVEENQEFAVKTQLRAHLVIEGRETIAEMMASNGEGPNSDPKSGSLAAN